MFIFIHYWHNIFIEIIRYPIKFMILKYFLKDNITTKFSKVDRQINSEFFKNIFPRDFYYKYYLSYDYFILSHHRYL